MAEIPSAAPPLVAAAAAKRASAKTCPKCGRVTQSRTALQLHLKRVYPCDLKPEDDTNTKTCHKCSKTFATSASLRLHLSKLVPCDAPQDKTHKCEKCNGLFTSAQSLRQHQSRVLQCDGSSLVAPGGKTCPKCHKTFTTAQGLRFHLLRVTPCDAEKSTKVKREKSQPAAAEEGELHECPRCQRSFSTDHGLRVHVGRKYCFLAMMKGGGKGEQLGSSVSADGTTTSSQAAASEIKSVGISDTPQSSVSKDKLSPGDNTTIEGSGKDGPVERESSKQTHPRSFQHAAMRGALHLKRGADRSNEDLSPVEKTIKRPRNEFGPYAALADRLLTDSPRNCLQEKSSASDAHNGDILTDGCCCRSCVRSWTQKMMFRLDGLKAEVESLRGMVSNVTITPQDLSDRADPMHVASSVSVDARAVAKQTTHDTSAESPGVVSGLVSNVSPEKVSLTVNYNHLNEQIVINERALEDSIVYLKKISGLDEASTLELCSQIEELKVYINAAKDKRDEAVAAIVTHRWKTTQSEFRLLLETMTVTNRPDAEKVFHEECVVIANQLADKVKVLSMNATEGKRCGRMSEYAVQKSAIQLLERERDEIFMRLLRSSRRIYLLTERAFQAAKK